MRRLAAGLAVPAVAVFAATVALAASPPANDTETFDLQPGVTAKQQRTAATEFTGNGTDVTFSGTISEKTQTQVCVYDAFYFSCTPPRSSAQPIAQANVYMGNVGHSNTTTFVPPFGTLPPYSAAHTYSFTSGTTGQFYFWAYPHGEPARGATYSGHITMSLTPVEPGECSRPGTRGAVASAVQNEVRVTCVENDCQYHKGGSAAGAWLPVSKDTVLKQGDDITCDPDSKAILAFSDNSTVKVGNVTALHIATFFTDGGVVKAEILMKMGEVAAQVNHEPATKSDFRIKQPTATASVRGTNFSVFYDPGSKVSVTSVNEGVVTVDPAKRGLKTVQVPAGKEVEVTRRSISKIAPLGKSDLHGGINRLQARDLVLGQIAANTTVCKLVTPRAGAFSARPKGRAWLVSVKTTRGKVKGTSTWRAAGTNVTPVNARAKKIARGCR